jgi:hypothetical protein
MRRNKKTGLKNTTVMGSAPVEKVFENNSYRECVSLRHTDLAVRQRALLIWCPREKEKQGDMIDALQDVR